MTIFNTTFREIAGPLFGVTTSTSLQLPALVPTTDDPETLQFLTEPVDTRIAIFEPVVTFTLANLAIALPVADLLSFIRIGRAAVATVASLDPEITTVDHDVQFPAESLTRRRTELLAAVISRWLAALASTS